MKVFFIIFAINFSLIAAEPSFNIQKFVERYCTDCHDEDIQKGDRRFDDLNPDIADLDIAERWQEVLDVLNLGEMPPKKKKQPSNEELLGAVDWLTQELAKAEQKFNGHASTVTMRKMTQYEYDQTTHSIFKFESKRFSPARHLPKDEINHGFKNIGEAQINSPIYMNSALKAANDIVIHALAQGGEKPKVRTVKMPPKSFRTKNGRTSIRMEKERDCVSLFNCSPKLSKAMSKYLKEGVHADGYYDFIIDVEAHGRIHKFPRWVYSPMRMEDKFVLQIGAEVYEDTSDGNCQDAGETLKLIELEDNQRQTFKLRIWLNKGESPSMLFLNGPPANSNFNAAALLGKYYPELLPDSYKKLSRRDRKRSGIVETDAYQGPRIRIWDAKLRGPFYPQWPMPVYKEFFGSANLNSTLSKAAEKILRRPLRKGELDALVSRTAALHKKSGDMNKALANTYRYLLTHPEFLYMVEAKSNNKTLGVRQYANRLSYFLKGEPADEHLLQELKRGSEISTLVDLQLSKDNAEYLGSHFADQWLQLHRLGMMPPDKKFKLYHRNYLESKMKKESQLLLTEAFEKNLTLTEVIAGNSTWVDRSLAIHYGISTKGLKEGVFTKVTLPEYSPRRGIIGHGSILTLTSNGVETSPIVRGVWILENILGIEPPPPPPDVPAIEPDIRGATTIKEQLSKHRNVETCNSCHQKIDPLGFTLEAFDPVGAFRKKYPNKKPIDTFAVYRDSKIRNADELVNFFEQNIDQVAHCVLEKMLMFATGRYLNFADKAEVRRLEVKWRKNNYKMRDLVKLVASSSMLANH
ncbi:MAG: DUF1588 domain-containing protein [Lentisphaerales bacterium]|nr:DUF1588 domain-containing protein [Lentisphaerales bacterium]